MDSTKTIRMMIVRNVPGSHSKVKGVAIATTSWTRRSTVRITAWLTNMSLFQVVDRSWGPHNLPFNVQVGSSPHVGGGGVVVLTL